MNQVKNDNSNNNNLNNDRLDDSGFLISYILKILTSYIILYSIYIQLNGEVSPGGGFQAGVIFASGIIVYDMLFDLKFLNNILTKKLFINISALGVMIYALVGVGSFFMTDNNLSNYLNYNSLSSDPIKGQHIGIFLIEIGVGITVLAAMILIYKMIDQE